MTLRIAITGVAGASGQSAIRAAQMMDDPPDIYPIDVTPFSAGLYMCQRSGVVLSKPEQDIEPWVDFVRREKIDAIIPGADRDLMPLSLNATDTKAIVSRPSVITIADDKAITAKTLQKMGVGVPKFAYPSMGDSWDLFPCIVKPRIGAASRGVQLCHDREEMDFWLKRTENAIIQEYVDADEYTCNVFVNSDGNPVAHMVMLRKERSGIAIQARPVEDAIIRDMMYRIGSALAPVGVLSVQLRKVFDTPKPFEMNARVSGSTIVRALAGYNDVEMLINHYVLGKPVSQTKIDYDHHYFRYYDVMKVKRSDLTDYYAGKESWL